jgi:ArsR family transcriptional regulator
MREIVDVFKALAEPMRIRILKLLEKKRMCVCELTAVLKVKQSSVSHHLRVLKNAGFVFDIRDGLWIDYELERKKPNKYAPELLKMLSSWLNSDSQIAKDLKVAEKVDRKDICKT